jgi:hypothetical protein
MIFELFLISTGISALLSLYLLMCVVEYREAIRRLQRDLEQTRQANANLAKIIQDDIDRKNEFEVGCG